VGDQLRRGVDVRGRASVLVLIAIAAGTVINASPSLASHCTYYEGAVVCDPSGRHDGETDSGDGADTGGERDWVGPRWVVDDGACYFFSWTAAPGALDMLDTAYDSRVFALVRSKPRCPWDTEDLGDAWQIFRSFPLTKPDPEFNPTTAGITGYPTYLAAANPSAINHSEPLPDGRVFQVRAWVGALQVDWGDGWVLSHAPTLALPYPDGGVTHIYKTKTCPPDYRINHPSGPNCHPTLEAYPVTATYTWWGEYRIGGGSWIPIGTLDLATTVLYDVDEVFGVLVDP